MLGALAEERSSLLFPTPVVAEYLAGRADPESELVRLDSSGTIVDFTCADAKAAADIARRLRAVGRFPGWTDVFLAGMVQGAGSPPIVTRNGRHIEGATVRTY